MAVKASATITLTRVDDGTIKSDSPPIETIQMWLDTSIEPHVLKEFDGENWVRVNDHTDDLANQKAEITNEYNAAINETAEAINLLVSKLTTSVNQNTESITGINNQINLTAEDIAFIKTTTETLQNIVDGKVDSTSIQEWARFDGAQLELGASNSPFKAIMSNTKLAFMQGDTEVSWISNNELHVLTAVITTAIGVGNGRLIDEEDDGVSFIMIT